MEAKARYRITVGDHLDGHWANWFEGIQIAHQVIGDGSRITLLESDEIDQAALHGILIRLRNLNLPLVSLERIEETSKRGERS